MTISVPLEPQDEARLTAVARAKGISTGELVRAALEPILAVEGASPGNPSSERPTGAALVAAMQASPWREIEIEPPRNRLPVRGFQF